MLAPVRRMRSTLGTMCDPHTAWLLMRSLETLKLRMEAGAAGARKVAEFLRDHPKIENVWYLDFLPKDHPDRQLHERQNKSAGSTFSFEVKGGEAAAFRLLDRLQVIKLAVSLGGTETLASHPAAMTHSGMPPEDLKRFSITPALDPHLDRRREPRRSDRRSGAGARRRLTRSRRLVGMSMKKMFAAVAALAALAIPASAQDARPSGQLPEGVTPMRYEITVTPNAQNLTLAGQVAHRDRSRAPTREIVLNALELNSTA